MNQIENREITQPEQPERQLVGGLDFAAATGSNDRGVGLRMALLCEGASGIRKFCDKDPLESFETTLQAMAALEPKDEIEGMLTTRMLALHNKGMGFLAQASADQGAQMCDLYVNMSTKIMRLCNDTLDNLMKYRRKGEQRVIVQHVNIEDGGKAIVGNSIGIGG